MHLAVAAVGAVLGIGVHFEVGMGGVGDLSVSSGTDALAGHFEVAFLAASVIGHFVPPWNIDLWTNVRVCHNM